VTLREVKGVTALWLFGWMLLGACGDGDGALVAREDAGTDSPVDACPADPKTAGDCVERDLGAVCTSPTDRCTCSGLRWWCEAVTCPTSSPIEGDACATSNLRCGARFEDPGYVCSPTADVWIKCQYARSEPASPRPDHCPASAPELGMPCCIVPTEAPRACAYEDDAGTSTFDCIALTWQPI
jgi:hypothetical protein